jgi:hypothetical protein
MKFLGQVAHMVERTGAYRVLVGKPEGKKLRGTHRHRWKYNIKIYIRELGCRGMNCIYLAQDKDRWRQL